MMFSRTRLPSKDLGATTPAPTLPGATRRPRRLALAAAALLALAVPAQATPSLLVDLDSGDVLAREEATRSWYPASISKLMTAYVALQQVRAGRVTLDTPLIVSKRAARMAPSKMGFKPGSEITLDNALKIIMVKSANDVAVTIAEGLGGSVEGFAQMMNEASLRLGMTQSNWVNPNGLPDPRQVTTARDMAILARALHRDFPEANGLWNIGAIQLGQRYMANHNGLIGRYRGADGMKTGFTCAAGFNVVATATRGGRRLLAVVLGQPSATERTTFAASLFDRGFDRAAAVGSLDQMAPGAGVGGAPDMRSVACTRRAKGGGYASEIEDLTQPIPSYAADVVAANPQLEFLFAQSGGVAAAAQRNAVANAPRPRAEPIMVYLGRAPGWSGQALGPRSAVAQVKPKPARGVSQADEEATALAPLSAPLRATDAGEAPAGAGKAKARKAKAHAGKAQAGATHAAKGKVATAKPAPSKADGAAGKSAGKNAVKSAGKSADKGAGAATKASAKKPRRGAAD